ncbi:unnamed protein product [Schistosoma rodhaini]|nr:unnamed protein product [Schistosoma rodhaini]
MSNNLHEFMSPLIICILTYLHTYACYPSLRSIGHLPVFSIQPSPEQSFPVVIHPFHICFNLPA